MTVNQTLTSDCRQPRVGGLQADGTQQYTATADDQFGDGAWPRSRRSPGPTTAGTISAAGLLHRTGYAGRQATVTASSGGVKRHGHVFRHRSAARRWPLPAAASPNPVDRHHLQPLACWAPTARRANRT